MSYPAGPPDPHAGWQPQQFPSAASHRYPQQPHGQGYPQQQPYPPPNVPPPPPGNVSGGWYGPPPQQEPVPVFPAQAVTKTRRVFDHSKHIKWTVFTLGVWGVLGYLPAWAWNRFGPEKSVSVTHFR